MTKTEEFIEKAKLKHNNKFDYSLVEYKNTHTKVKIICPEHGVYEQRPMDHIKGFGCGYCSGRGLSLSLDMVKTRIRAIHGDKYDTSLVEFATIYTPITLICAEHGEFQITPKSIFLQKAGCNKCAYEQKGLKRRKTLETFLAEAKAVHGDKYDYSKVMQYDGDRTKITITCPIHGDFVKNPADHIGKKQGCKVCAYKGGKGGYTHTFFDHNPDKKLLPGVLYAAHFTNGSEQFIKIGITAKTTKQRFDRAEYKNMTIEMLHERYMPLYDAFCIEQDVITKLKDYRFYSNTRFSGNTECFRNTPEVLTEIQNIFINNLL